MIEPVTMRNIVDYVSIRTGVEPVDELEDKVKKTVKGGLRYGYLQAKDGNILQLRWSLSGEEKKAIPEDRTGGRRRRRRSVRRSSNSHSNSRSRRRRRH